MRLLIDECIDERFRFSFPDHYCVTARFAGFAGLKNWRLLEAAEQAGFDVLVTVDQNLPNQQNMSGRRLSILVLRTQTNRLSDVLPFLPIVADAPKHINPGSISIITQDR